MLSPSVQAELLWWTDVGCLEWNGLTFGTVLLLTIVFGRASCGHRMNRPEGWNSLVASPDVSVSDARMRPRFRACS
jgi:hypothetical protein